MWKERTVILNEEKKIVFMGEKVLEYIDRSGELPLAYPAGVAEKGDLLVCYSKRVESFKSILTALGLTLPATLKKGSDGAGFLLVWELHNEAVAPIIKTESEKSPGVKVLLDTIYVGKELRVESGEEKLKVLVDGQQVEWEQGKLESCGLLVDGFGAKYYGIDIEQVLKEGSFESRKDFSGIYENGIEKIFPETVLECFANMNAGEGKRIFNFKGKMIRLSCRTVEFEGLFFSVCRFEDSEDLFQMLAEHSDAYKEMMTDADRQRVRKQQVTTFRLFGAYEKMEKTERLLQKGSVTNTTILLTGESGTGKTFLAQQIHRNSKRHKGPFVHVNCAAIPYQLIESELFGYEDGAFTGARKGGKQGFFEMAAGGTLFLDEITEIPISLQGKLLEVLQNKTFYRVGGTKKLETDLRVIAATNRDLKKEIAEKRFREDLYYRIHVFPVEIPPLRARVESIYEIICDILPGICNRLEMAPLIVSSQALEKMEGYSWPGNIRELENVLEKAAILSDGKVILPEDVVLEGEDWISEEIFANSKGENCQEKPIMTLKEQKERCEEEAIREALVRCGGNKEQAARELEIGRSNLFEKIKKYQIDVKE